MAKQNNSNLMDSVLETQKNIVEKMVESSKKLTNGNTMINETLNKGSEWYQNWIDAQKKIMQSGNTQAETLGSTFKENAQKANDYFQNFQNQQSQFAKQAWDMNQNWFKAATEQAKSFDMSNPAALFQNWMQQMQQAYQNMNQQNWANPFQNWSKNMMAQNPFSMDSYQNTADTMTKLFNQYGEMMNYSLSNLQNALKGNTPQDAFRNMMNINEGFLRFAEMWTPFMKNIQNKTFNMDSFKQMVSPEAYKNLMDQLFGLMPEHTAQYFQNWTKMMQDASKNFSMKGNYAEMKNAFQSAMPQVNPNAMMDQFLGSYQNFKNSMNSIFAPMGKMLGKNDYTQAAAEWSDLADKMVKFNLKNAEMQYMIYERGTKVMEQVAETIMNKQENGEEIGNLMSLYQEWLNLSDAAFVELFESDAYSEIMAEVASLKMKLTKEADTMLEKSFASMPIATKSEIEELHKTIYDLKKEVRQLAKMLDMETEVEETAAPKASTKKASKK